MSNPRVSVVIPARDAASVINDQLAALSRQSIGESWQLIVVNHASRDETVQCLQAWQERLPFLEILDGSSAQSQAEARNLGLERVRGEFVIFCDADDVVDDGWLAAMIQSLREASIVTGPLDLRMLNDPKMSSWRQDEPEKRLQSRLPFLPYALTCNLGVRREVIDRIGNFDPAFRSGYDVDFSWRAQQAGFELTFDPAVVVHKRYVATPFQYWQREIRYGRYHALLWKRYRSHGMRRSSPLRAPLAWAKLVLLLPQLLSHDRRWAWLARCGNRVGRIIGSIQHRVLYL